MQLGEQAAEFRKRGYGVAALTYDSVELLGNFQQHYGLRYTLLSDPESKVIRAFDILNDKIPKDHEWYGVPNPGMYLIDPQGIVRAKYFEESVVERYTAASVLHYIDDEDGMVSGWAETDHLKVTVSASDYKVRPGNRITLILHIELKPGLHVYAPGVKGGYKPLRWDVRSSIGWKLHEVQFPEPRTLELPALHETLPVYEGSFLLSRDVTLGQLEQLAQVVKANGELLVQGTLRYQACNDRECFPPGKVPLKWTLRGQRHDSRRAPPELRKSGR